MLGMNESSKQGPEKKRNQTNTAIDCNKFVAFCVVHGALTVALVSISAVRHYLSTGVRLSHMSQCSHVRNFIEVIRLLDHRN